MASRKEKLGALIQRPSTAHAATAQPPDRPAQPLYTLSEVIELPAAATVLSAEVQDLARQLIATRRRIGKELLEAARLTAEARAKTEHGQWLIFLEVTGTGADTAERLLNIHKRIIELPAFEAAISTGRLTESTAWRLAQPSTSLEAIGQVLSKPQPLTVRFVEQHLRTLRKLQEAPSPRQKQWPAQEQQIPPHGGISESIGQTILVLSAEDRAAAKRLTRLLVRCAAGEERLSPEDWEVLAPLAEVLALVQQQR